METIKIIRAMLHKKGLSKQQALKTLDEAKTLIEENYSFPTCEHCNAFIYDEDAKYCVKCGKKINY